MNYRISLAFGFIKLQTRDINEIDGGNHILNRLILLHMYTKILHQGNNLFKKISQSVYYLSYTKIIYWINYSSI